MSRRLFIRMLLMRPEQFQEKWEPVFRPELRLTITQFQEKWEPVFRPELRPAIKQFQENRKPAFVWNFEKTIC